ncbi:MAG: tyrosine-type recombinase/integrase [Desulfococcaceae bacterium]
MSARGDLIRYSAPSYAQSEHFQNLLNKFSTWIQTDNTRAADLQPIYRFFSVCGKSPEKIEHDDILNWINRLRADTRKKFGREISNRTICLHLSAISKFSRFLILQGHPTVPGELLRKESVNLPRQSGTRTPESLDPAELQTLLDTIRKAKTHISVRDCALFSVTFCCALRAGEAVNLKTGHILFDPEKFQVRIHGRKNKRDIIQILNFTDRRDRKLLQTVKDWGSQLRRSAVSLVQV